MNFRIIFLQVFYSENNLCIHNAFVVEITYIRPKIFA